MAYLSPDFDYDIFISFSHGDNSLLPGENDPNVHGWVKRFAEQLETWLRDQRRLAGLKVWLDLDRLSGATQFDERISTDLGRTAILLVLHSHNYRESDYCRQELEWFLDAAGKQPVGLAPGGVRRVFNVVINNIPHQDWDDSPLWEKAFAGTPGFRFHDAPADDPDAFGDPLSETEATAYRDGLKPIVETAYKLSIHLLDCLAGRRMDGGSLSYVRSQAQLATQGETRSMLWLPETLSLDDIADDDHRAWLQSLATERRDGASFELLRGTPTQLINDLLERIQALSALTGADDRERTLVVDPHQLDQLAGLELSYRLSKRAPNVRLLITRDGAEPAERWADFEDLVAKAEEFVVVFGRVAPQWVASRIERALKVAATHFSDGFMLRRIWVLLLPDCPGSEALPRLPPLINVETLDNKAATQISDAVIERILHDGGAA